MMRDRLPSLPSCPGVYLMKNAAGRIIYVGKAKHLRRRVASYFRPDEQLSPKTRVMMSKAEDLDFLCTATEKEALLLEASLIKEHRPKYNIVLRDDKQYALFCLSKKHPFPALRLTRKVEQDGGVYFGPFTSALAARETRRIIDRLFPLRKCRDTVFSNRTRPCLQYHLGRCLGPCVLPVSEGEYAEVVRQVELFLSGKSAQLLTRLRTEMRQAAEALRFEQAAGLRDSIRALEATLEQQAAVLGDSRELDVIGVHAQEHGVGLGSIFVRQGRIIDGQNFWFPGVSLTSPGEEQTLVDTFVMQFYTESRYIPKRIVTALGSADVAVEGVLTDIRGSKVSFSKARGDQERRLVDIATANARVQSGSQKRSVSAAELGRALGLDVDVERLECVDASHLHGEGMRVGQVVFVLGQEEKSAYRLYAFPELEGTSDDYLALARFVVKRLRSGPPWPDVLLVDGGKGQLHAVEQALEAENGQGLFALAAIAKGESRRAGELGDQVFVPGRKNSLRLRPGSPELLFLQHARDTAHRFVLSRLRQHKRKTHLDSKLETLPGVGPRTAALLWQYFDSLESMCSASVEALAALPGLGRKKAQKVHRALQECAKT